MRTIPSLYQGLYGVTRVNFDENGEKVVQCYRNDSRSAFEFVLRYIILNNVIISLKSESIMRLRSKTKKETFCE